MLFSKQAVQVCAVMAKDRQDYCGGDRNQQTCNVILFI